MSEPIKVYPSSWAAAAHDVVLKNKDQGGWVSRHAIAWGFIYALLDIADAIRYQTSERSPNSPTSAATNQTARSVEGSDA